MIITDDQPKSVVSAGCEAVAAENNSNKFLLWLLWISIPDKLIIIRFPSKRKIRLIMMMLQTIVISGVGGSEW